MPPSRRRSRQPSATSERLTALTNAGRAPSIARPFRWHRSSGTRAERKLGRHSGRKLAVSLMVARQQYSVLTKTLSCSYVDRRRRTVADAKLVAEGVGFEPTREREPPGGFQDRCLKP